MSAGLEYIVPVIIRIAIIVYGIFLLKFLYKIWKDNRNPIDLAVFIMVISMTVIQATWVVDTIGELFNFDLEEYLQIANLNFTDIAYVTYGAIFGWFIFYIYDVKLLYSLPFTIVFFIEAYIVVANDRAPQFVFMVLVITISSAAMLLNSIKNKQGMSFALFAAGMVNLLEFVVGAVWFSLIANFLIYQFLLMGANGWFDEKVFYDRAEREKVKNVWISRVVDK